MPKNITRVKWSATGIPSGISFDEQTGTFSGTPDDEGEHTVPVTVETNYGTDTKDVIIDVAKAYPVYSIGQYADNWSTLDDQVDKYGFYPLNMPSAKELFLHAGGFYALSKDNILYRLGVTNLTATSRGDYPYSYDSTMRPTKVGDYSKYKYLLDQVHYRLTVDIRDGDYFFEVFDVLISRANNESNKISVTTGGRVVGISSGNVNNLTYINTSITVPNSSLLTARDIGETSEFIFKSSYNVSKSKREPIETVYYLSEDGTKIQKIRFTYGGSNTNISVTTSVSELGYCARKMFFSDLFAYLSEDNYLNNDPNNFSYGKIKDAYIRNTTAYVQTDNDELYSYDNDNNDWVKLGNFSIKKVEIYSSGNVTFMLTNDGKLYHKGSAVTDVTDEHAEFTQLFPDCYFHDFTFGRDTLTVIKE